MTILAATGTVVAFLALAGVSAVLSDETRGWVVYVTRWLARTGARMLPPEQEERGTDWIANVEGEIEDAGYRPIWLLGQNLRWTSNTARTRWRLRRQYEAATVRRQEAEKPFDMVDDVQRQFEAGELDPRGYVSVKLRSSRDGEVREVMMVNKDILRGMRQARRRERRRRRIR